MTVALGWALSYELDSIPLTDHDLWLAYVALGGHHNLPRLLDYLTGRTEWTAIEHDQLAHAINEELMTLRRPQTAIYADA